jgi:YesN/AraC family two-component response regulator
MEKLSVVLVDDHQVVLHGLRAILDPDPNFTLVGEVSTGKEALSIVKSKNPDIVVLDFKLPDMTGSELCQRIVEL